ncbi:ketosteroid isomerase-like protein [Chitinophaga skermanii]|uniref:Ketosteroid isomerase-like protein n=1 Tax=Chitinophaga skermanii TaxID=331697 RepID=A0A327QY28_9BACT|nr:nuclear transport factor 2 family protein [Chitinophaga skermanii]RAJ08634.1 ketosteroid isomerase-like protein [Chitinophaga skermanii]
MKSITMLAMLIGMSCIAKAQSNESSLQEVRKIIEKSNATYADFANKNDGSILLRYTNDACLFPPNAAPVCGRNNMAKFFKDGPKVHTTFTIQHLYGDGKTFVTEESYYEMTDFNGKKIDEGKVVVVWKHTNEGWKMHRDMFSSNYPKK